MSQHHHAFPLLEVGEIVQYLKGQFPELSPCEADFRSPKMERWQCIYTGMMEFLTDQTPDQLHQHQLEAIPQFEYPELYDNALPLMKLTVCIRRVMQACGIDDFTVRDIIEPTSKRCLRNMSAFINYCFFRRTRIEVYEAIKEENNALLEQRNTLAAENKELEAGINSIKITQAEQEPLVTEYAEKIEQARQECESLHKVATTKQKTLTDAKLRLSEKQAKIAQLKAKVAAAKEKGSALSQQIVQSPERMKKEVERNTRYLEQLKVALEQRQLRLLELHNMRESTVGIEADISQALKFVTSVKTSIDNQKEKEREILSLRDQVMERKDELQNLEAREQQLKRIIANKLERTSKIRLTHANSKKTQELLLQQMLAEQERLKTQQTQEAIQKEALILERHQLVEDHNITAANHKAKMASLREAYENLLQQVEMYHMNLRKSWEQTHRKF